MAHNQLDNKWKENLRHVKLPAVPTEDCDWYINAVGMTMIKMTVGSDTVYVSDREVSVRAFNQFVQETGYNWQGHDKDTSPGDDYPVTYIREHKDYVIATDEDTARKPKVIL